MTQTTLKRESGPDEDVATPKMRRLLPKILIGVAIVLVAATGAGMFYSATIDRSLTENLNRGVELPTDESSVRPPKEPQETGTLNYVLLGSDSRDPGNEGNGRSDTILVVHLNAKRNKAYIISFPRDMYVNVPGYGRNKINAAFAFGGTPLAVRTVENLSGVRMDHVALIDFEGFIRLTEDLHGVTVTNKTAFSSHGFDYPKGKITIAGEEALWFVRERKLLPGGDLDRAENQRNVIKAIVQKGLSARVISDPSTFLNFLSNVAKYLTVDNDLSDAEIKRTAHSLRLGGKDIDLLQAPISGFATTGDGQSIDIVDTAKMAELAHAMKKDKLSEYVKKYPQG
ncbi:MAG TPA: LCP family protein [Propionibacteriaceae bacterium]|jgi:LCP family protein required for cell wall assembly|nr:LCP family protein [Propionibacteriaceae bacterium]